MSADFKIVLIVSLETSACKIIKIFISWFVSLSEKPLLNCMTGGRLAKGQRDKKQNLTKTKQDAYLRELGLLF